MKEHPILFNGPMVRALLDGRKTQTRRVMKPQPTVDAVRKADGTYFDGDCMDKVITKPLACPYPIGSPLWVRETWQEYVDGNFGDPVERVAYRASEETWPLAARLGEDWRWASSIHMPRWASRITLEVTDVRVQRVQEISTEDAIAEGCTGDYGGEYAVDGMSGPQVRFMDVWDSAYAKRGYGWGVNPWVWAVTFKRLEE